MLWLYQRMEKKLIIVIIRKIFRTLFNNKNRRINKSINEYFFIC